MINSMADDAEAGPLDGDAMSVQMQLQQAAPRVRQQGWAQLMQEQVKELLGLEGRLETMRPRDSRYGTEDVGILRTAAAKDVLRDAQWEADAKQEPVVMGHELSDGMAEEFETQ